MSIDLYSYPACLGTLTIDWKNRTIEVKGMDGDDGDDMTVDDVTAVIEAHRDQPDVEVMPLIFWTENEQLAVHDEASFAGEVAHDREVKGDDDEEPAIKKIWQLTNSRYRDELDVVAEIIVRAADAAAARVVASQSAGDEGADLWLDESRSTCSAIDMDGPDVVIAVESKGF